MVHLEFYQLKEMMSTIKIQSDLKFIEKCLQERVSWDDPILLPYGLHLYIVQKPNGDRIVKCDCGHEFCDYRENWKLQAKMFVRDTRRK